MFLPIKLKKTWVKVFAWFFLFHLILPANLFALAQEESSSSAVLSPTAEPTAVIGIPTKTEVTPDSSFLTPTATISQELTPTPADIPTLAPTAFPSEIITPTQFFSPTPTLFPTIFLEESPISNPSAATKQPVKTRLLSSNNLQANESLTIELLNTEGNPVGALLKRGEDKVEVNIRQKILWGSVVLIVDPPVGLRPGKYTLEVTDSLGNVSEQEFLWGVLAINFNKSIYSPSDIARISIAVLDERGYMVCDAKVELNIKSQELGVDDLLSTENKGIVVNPECMVKDYVAKPDYEAIYQVGNPGRYEITLTAETRNGQYSINDGFEVRQTVPFEVERVTATRIYPPVFYPMRFNITANQDFEGVLEEIIPDNFIVVQANEGLPYESIRVVPYSQTLPLEGKNPDVIDLRSPFDGNFQITLGFGQQLTDPVLKELYAEHGLTGHDGIDFDLPIGTVVLAADDGEVVLTEESGDYGKTVVIQHSWGRSYYGHLSEITVQQGEKKEKGSLIGSSGDSGLTTGPHLHFGIKLKANNQENGYYGKIDPLPYLSFSTVVSKESVKLITWKVNLKKGDKISLGYDYQTPSASPQFYLLGPLAFKTNIIVSRPVTEEKPFVFGVATESGGLEDLEASSSGVVLNAGSLGMVTTVMTTVFQEIRQWQLAIDDSTTFSPGASGNWNAPITGNVTVECWGGGGSGGGGYNTAYYGGGGGAGGQYAIKVVPVTEGTPYAYSVAADVAGVGRGINGNTGNDTTFDSTTVVAKGGAPGLAQNSSGTAGQGGQGSIIGGNGDTVYKGGNGASGTSTYGGGSGSGAGSSGDGNSATTSTGGIAKTEYGGAGGDGSTASSGNGSIGGDYGGGGGGATRNGTSGVGRGGYIRLTWAAASGPTLDQLMRHGGWFNSSNVRQPFTF